MTKKINLYFLGSGEIAVPILTALVKSQCFNVLGVGTQPDRPAGRKRLLQPTPLALAAENMNLTVERVQSVNEAQYVEKLRRMELDIIVVVSFGQLLKEELLNLPKFGCVNVHASILPKYRGASPINAAILNQDAKSGVTFMAMERGLDTGKIFRIIEKPLNFSERCDELEMALGELAAAHIEDTLCQIVAGSLKGAEQDHALATLTKKIKKHDGIIDFNQNSAQVHALCRAAFPWPGASFRLRFPNKELIVQVLRSRSNPELSAPSGTIIQADKNGLIIACNSGALEILEVLTPGRKPMSYRDFLNGCSVADAKIDFNYGKE